MKLHAGIVEICVAKLIGFRTNTIVPNVSWGLGLNHECDMLVLDKQDRFTEIEIKVTLADLKKDFIKEHKHYSKYITRLIYAFPEELLEKGLELIPKECGIIVIYKSRNPSVLPGYRAEWYRQVKHRKTDFTKPDQKMIRKFMELRCMRIWNLKQHNYFKK